MADTMGTLMVGGPVTGTTLTIADSALTQLNSGWANGVTAYIDPYHGVLDGNSVLLFCVDPNHLDNNNPLGYQVSISPNGTGSNTLQALNYDHGTVTPNSHILSSAATQAGFTSVSQLYGGLAWLSEQLQGTTNTVDRQKYQAAIWQLGDYTSTFTVVNPPYIGDLKGIEHDAMTNALGSGFSVLTDANEVANGKNAGQEYIILTPEPCTVLLFASGVFGLFMLRRSQLAGISKA
ncbi:MAG: hypothetical protein DMG60_02790 [Acidobacteria bacterium]|nr:MAG: hypothetical protein DMG60_02790 [Acidobacteriota bacterium]